MVDANEIGAVNNRAILAINKMAIPVTDGVAIVAIDVGSWETMAISNHTTMFPNNRGIAADNRSVTWAISSPTFKPIVARP